MIEEQNESGSLMGLTVHFIADPMLVQDIMNDDEAQSGSALFRSKEGIKDLFRRVAIHSFARV